MYTIISLLLIFLVIVFSILLYFKSKKDRQLEFDMGICPQCGKKAKTFKDENSGITFKVDVIKTRLIKSHGCSGISEFEYKCSNCGLKEIHNSIGQGCLL
jgi:predicted RNA-binding Zn-ribbon protein involved in translation (DUF1610 family)